MTYHVVTTNGVTSFRQNCETWTEATNQARRDNHIWPNYDALIYSNGGLVSMFRKGVECNVKDNTTESAMYKVPDLYTLRG